jgi:hypothetical protein
MDHRRTVFSDYVNERSDTMAVTITVGFSRKVGEPNYGSRGASLHVEIELERHTMDDPERFQSEVEKMFDRLREEVDRELQRKVPSPSDTDGSSEGDSSEPKSSNGRRSVPRSATPNQIRAIQTIARHRGVDLSQLVAIRFEGRTAAGLSIVEASLLIDELQSFPLEDKGELQESR